MLIITFANYVFLVSNRKMCANIGKHLFDSNSAKERVVFIRIFNKSILISYTLGFPRADNEWTK